MKPTIRKILGVILTFAMLLSVFSGIALPLRAFGALAGETIEFGAYPQSRVTDETLIAALNDAPKTWTGYNYMTGTDHEDDGLMEASDYMKFADFVFNGEKFRAVTFTKYRPRWLYWEASATQSLQYNDTYLNGYRVNEVYYFKYEPLLWRVLDPQTGYVMCESLIDAQSFCNVVYKNGNYLYHGIGSDTYANDYAASDLRAWLNYNFFDTAFSAGQKEKIKTSALENGLSDKIFLMSKSDVENRSYGFTESYNVESEGRKGYATDYAKAQGAWVDGSSGGTTWWLTRTQNGHEGIYYVLYSGKVVGYDSSVKNTSFGIRPVCCLTDLLNDASVSDFLFSEHIEQGCNYLEPTWTWAPDHTSATAVFPCSLCSREYKLTDASPAVTTISERSCTAPYVVKYTATVSDFGDTFTDTTDEVTLAPAAGHTYGSEGDARFTCAVCTYEDEALKAAAEAADQLAGDKEEFDGYKAEAKDEADGKAQEGDSAACADLIAQAKSLISALEYDENKTLEENKAAVDEILDKLVEDLTAQRAADQLAGDKEEFDGYKAEAKDEANGKAQTGDSAACADLITQAKSLISALNYDEALTLEQNKAVVDEILDKLDEDLAAQRAADQLAGDKEEFDGYKAEAKDEADGKAQTGDSEAVSKLIDDAKDAIDNLEYDEDKTPEENKAAVDEILDQLDEDLAAQRAAADADSETEDSACRLCGEYHDSKTIIGFFTGILHNLIFIIKRLIRFFSFEIFVG